MFSFNRDISLRGYLFESWGGLFFLSILFPISTLWLIFAHIRMYILVNKQRKEVEKTEAGYKRLIYLFSILSRRLIIDTLIMIFLSGSAVALMYGPEPYMDTLLFGIHSTEVFIACTLLLLVLFSSELYHWSNIIVSVLLYMILSQYIVYAVPLHFWLGILSENLA